MQIDRTAWRAVIVFCLLGPAANALAQSSLPPEVLARIEEAARESLAFARRDAAVSQNLSYPPLASNLARHGKNAASATMSATVIGAIAERPALAAEIVSAAVAANPEVAERVVRDAASAYPAFAERIAAATGYPVVPALPPVRDFPIPPTAPVLTDPPVDYEVPEFGAEPVYAAGGALEDIDDSFEGYNRFMFEFNDVFDTFITRPIAAMYGAVTPDVVKDSIRNAFKNYSSPVILANDLFQLEGGDALVTTGRMIVNTTVGIGGLFDVAETIGLPHHPADFGQTLHSYGVGSGSYLVLPIVGPSSVRDGFGRAVDAFLHPLPYLVDTEIALAVSGAQGIVLREEFLVPLEEVRATSIDFYAAVRSLYNQDRAVVLRKGQAAVGDDDLDALFKSVE